MNYLWVALIGGAAAFPHCLGMCGGFALHLAAGPGRMQLVLRQLFWHLGRIVTYVFLGALAGYFGAVVFSMSRWTWTKSAAGYAVGAVMVLMGISLVGLMPARARATTAPDEEGLFTSIFRQFFMKGTPASSLALGLANGFLPCPIVVGFLMISAQAGSVLKAMAIMTAMGIGTVWPLLLLGMTGHAVSVKWRRGGAVALGVLLVMLGMWTLLRKLGVVPPLPGGGCCF